MGLRENGRVAAVGKRASLLGRVAGDVVLFAAEGLEHAISNVLLPHGKIVTMIACRYFL
jgi:hypothetical protein